MLNKAPLHPDHVLFAEGDKPLPELPAVEHFAGNEKFMRKALALQHEMAVDGIAPFDITLDCEDGAAAGAEREQAQLVARMLQTQPHAGRVGARVGMRVGARIHDLTHPVWRDEIDIIVGEAGPQLAYLTLPKPRGVSDVERLLGYLRNLEARLGLRREIPLHALIETHGALHQVWEIASLPGIETLDFGLMDFVSAHQGAIPGSAMRSPGQFTHPLVARAKQEVAAAALAHGVLPSHNVSTELADMDGVESDARLAREEFGYLRMWSIHPAQIDAILRGMRPEPTEVRQAGEILIAAQDAQWGPVRHGERLHDRASFRYYWNLLRRAHATGIALEPLVMQRFFDSPPRD